MHQFTRKDAETTSAQYQGPIRYIPDRVNEFLHDLIWIKHRTVGHYIVNVSDAETDIIRLKPFHFKAQRLSFIKGSVVYGDIVKRLQVLSKKAET